MELGKLKLLQVPGGLSGEGSMPREYFGVVDSVLLEISQQNQEKLAGARRGVGLKGQAVPTGAGNEDEENDASNAPNKTIPTKFKMLCSMPYHASDREATVNRAVDFVRRHNARDHKLKQERRTPVPVPSPSEVNNLIDAEVAELQSLRGQRQWRVNLMAKLERTSRVNAARTQLGEGEGEGPGGSYAHVDVRRLVGIEG